MDGVKIRSGSDLELSKRRTKLFKQSILKIMEDIQKQVVKIALRKLFTAKHFSICDIDKCLKLSQIIPNKKDYDTMSALHCIDYSDMNKDVREWLLNTVESMFMGSGFDLSFLEKEIKVIEIEEPKQRKGFLRLLGN